MKSLSLLLKYLDFLHSVKYFKNETLSLLINNSTGSAKLDELVK